MKRIINAIKMPFSWCRKIFHSRLNRKVLYKIVDYTQHNRIIHLQSTSTRAIFPKKLELAILDTTIISNLSPEQSCYLGILTGESLKKGELTIKKDHRKFQQELLSHTNTQFIFDRSGNVSFIHPKTKQRCVVKPELIVSKAEYINIFHPTVACALGIFVGSKKIEDKNYLGKTTKPLSLVTTENNTQK